MPVRRQVRWKATFGFEIEMVIAILGKRFDGMVDAERKVWSDKRGASGKWGTRDTQFNSSLRLLTKKIGVQRLEGNMGSRHGLVCSSGFQMMRGSEHIQMQVRKSHLIDGQLQVQKERWSEISKKLEEGRAPGSWGRVGHGQGEGLCPLGTWERERGQAEGGETTGGKGWSGLEMRGASVFTVTRKQGN